MSADCITITVALEYAFPLKSNAPPALCGDELCKCGSFHIRAPQRFLNVDPMLTAIWILRGFGGSGNGDLQWIRRPASSTNLTLD